MIHKSPTQRGDHERNSPDAVSGCSRKFSVKTGTTKKGRVRGFKPTLDHAREQNPGKLTTVHSRYVSSSKTVIG